MAGQPRKRAMIDELERRADEREMTPLEYAVDWVESGQTLTQLVSSLNASIKRGDTYVTRAMVSRYLNGLEGGVEALAGARAEGSHGLAESAVDIIDEPAESKIEAAQRKTQAEIRLKLAGFWNRPEYGEAKGPQLNVNLDLGQLHLDALRMREIAPPAPALPPAVEGQDYEVVSDA